MALSTNAWYFAYGLPAPWFLTLVDIVLWLLWTYHDFLHGPIFGRGDGR